MITIKNILFNLFLSILFLLLNSNSNVSGFDISDQVLVINSPFTLANGENLNLINATIIFNTTDIYISPTSNITTSYDCAIKSATYINITIASLVGSSPGSFISTINLENITIEFTGNSTLFDTVIEMNDNSSLFVNSVNLVGIFDNINDGDSVFKGGLVRIDSLNPMLCGVFLYPGNILKSSGSLPTLVFRSTVYTNRIFSTAFPIIVPSTQYLQGGLTGKYNFFGKLSSPGESLIFTNFGLTIYGLDLGGGSLNITNAVWDLSYNITEVTNTTINFNDNSTFVMNQISPTLGVSPFGVIQLDGSSNLRFNTPYTTTLAMNVYFQLFKASNPYPSIQIASLVSDDGRIDCNGITNTTYETTPAQLHPLNLVGQLLSGTNLRFLGAMSSCSSQTLSVRFWDAQSNKVESPSPICEDNQIFCYAVRLCTTLEYCLYYSGLTCFLPIYSAAAQTGLLQEASTSSQDIPTCWNGVCAENIDDCDPFPACPPDLPRRCSGYCAPINATCNHCDYPCPQGCLNATSIAECSPYYGCGVGQIQCPDNHACVEDIAQCQEHGSKILPYTYKYLKSAADLYANYRSNAAMWSYTNVASSTEKQGYDSKSHIAFPSGAVPNSLPIVQFNSMADSLAVRASGSNIRSDFNYYDHVLTSPLKLQFFNSTAKAFINHLNFGDNNTISFYFNLGANSSIDPKSVCFAFINANQEWECTPYEIVARQNGIFEARTTHFSNFALLLKYSNKDKGDSGDDTSSSSNTKMIIIATSVVGGVLLTTAAVAWYVNFKLKNYSFRRWSVRVSKGDISDLDRFKEKNFRAR